MDIRPLMDSHPVPAATREVISDIVAAVQAGDDALIKVLLGRLAPIADITALLLLRHRLNRDLGGPPQPASEVSGCSGDGVSRPGAHRRFRTPLDGEQQHADSEQHRGRRRPGPGTDPGGQGDRQDRADDVDQLVEEPTPASTRCAEAAVSPGGSPPSGT